MNLRAHFSALATDNVGWAGWLPLNIQIRTMTPSQQRMDAATSNTKLQQPRPRNADHNAMATPDFPLSEFANFYPGPISVVKERKI